MIPNQNRRKGGGPLLGATLPGLDGPFGTRPAADDQDDTEVPAMASLADNRIAAQIAAYARRRQAQQERRARFREARNAGLAKRHARKLRLLAQREADSVADTDGNPNPPPAA